MSEERIESERIYEGRVVSLRKDKVKLPNGRISSREVVEHKCAAVIIAENSAGELLLIKQYRYPVGKEMIELPAGIVELGEDPADAASRELQEETGWRPGSLELVAEVYSSPGFTTEIFSVFYASDLVPNKLQADDDEFITPSFYSRADVESLVADGSIDDSKTLLGILWWLRRQDERR